MSKTAVSGRKKHGSRWAYSPMTDHLQYEFVSPEQYYQRTGAPLSGERRLLLALLDDASGVLTATSGERVKLRQEIRAWVTSDARGALDGFYFVDVCDRLGLDVGWARRRMLALAPRRSNYNRARNGDRLASKSAREREPSRWTGAGTTR